MAQHDLSKIIDDNGEEYLIKAKAFESQKTIALANDVTGSATSDFSNPAQQNDPTITIQTTISNGAVTESKIATDAVTNAKIKDGEIQLAKLNSSVYNETAGTIADGTNSNLATKTQVKTYVENVLSSEGKYRGVQTVNTINGWSQQGSSTVLHNGDRVIIAANEEGTLVPGNLHVIGGQECVYFESDDGTTKEWQSSEGNYKIIQTAVSDPSASGTTLTAIDSISQNPNGEISVTKKTIQDGTTSQKGVVQLQATVAADESSDSTAATPKSVRDAINALDVTAITGTTAQTITSISEADGKISATYNNIQIAASQVTGLSTSLDAKADKVDNATNGNFAGLDANGNLTDSHSKASDFATSAQGTKADSALQGIKAGATAATASALTPDQNKVVTITKADLGLGNVDNTADANKSVLSATKLTTARTIDGVSFNGESNITHYGTCATTAGTAAKEVTCTGFTLAQGARIAVTFSTTNTASNPTLNVSSTGAKAIKYRGSAISTGTLAANRTYEFIYDSTEDAYLLVGDINTSNTPASTAPEDVSSTAAVGTSSDYARADHVHAISVATGDASGQVKIAGQNATVNGWSDKEDKSNKVTSWSATLLDTNYPSEKLVKDSLDTKASVVSNATEDNFASFTSTGNIQDSGKKASDFATASHDHGNITNSGTITSDTSVANGDKIVIVDADNNKVARSGISFDGSDTTKALTPKGTFESFLQTHQTIKQDGVTGATANRYGVCSTGAATAAKAVSVTAGTFNKEAGARVTVKFANTNTAATPTLNVNSTGAANIYYRGAQITTNGASPDLLSGVVEFIYDGTNYHLIGGGQEPLSVSYNSSDNSLKFNNVSFS